MQISVAPRSAFDINQILADERHYNSLVQAHGSMMAFAYLLVLPTGAVIARLVSHQHQVLAALACILTAVYKYREGGIEATQSIHAKFGAFGVFVISALVLQIVFALFMILTYNASRAYRQRLNSRIVTGMHRLWGYVVLISEFNLGIK
ncbi:hypothetical protein BGZ83_011272 [Gryganskiella cystojenkinii]|nr:hypothetical protein BGZ83_011272 [Gryganskiella cystojenkinii]